MYARKRLFEVAGQKSEKAFFLMDYKAGKARYERQVIDSGGVIDRPGFRGGGGHGHGGGGFRRGAPMNRS